MKLKFDESCSILNSISEQEMIAYFNGKLSEKRTIQIEEWLRDSSDLRDAFEGFRKLVELNPDENFNNYSQKSKEQFLQKAALHSALTKSTKK